MKTLTIILLATACLLCGAITKGVADETPDAGLPPSPEPAEIRLELAEHRITFLVESRDRAFEELSQLANHLDRVCDMTESAAALLSESDRSKVMADLLLKQMLLEAEVTAAQTVKERRSALQSESSGTDSELLRAKVKRIEVEIQLTEKELANATQLSHAGKGPLLDVDKAQSKLRGLQIEREYLETEQQRENTKKEIETELLILSKNAELAALRDQLQKLRESNRSATEIRLLQNKIQQASELVAAINMRLLAARMDLLERKIEGGARDASP